MLFFKKKTPRKTPGDMTILHLCTKNLDNMIYSSRDIDHDRHEIGKLEFWVIFCPFTPLTIKILKK